jgi:hypothetical protein
LDRIFFFNYQELTKEVPNIIATYSEGKSTLVFCTSRQSTKVQAQELRRYAISGPGGSMGGSRFVHSSAQQRELEQASVRCEDVDLRDTLRTGVGFHNAQLRVGDRMIVEELFTKGALKCCCSTSTLALGVNLPAHLVVVRSTLQYAGSAKGYREIPTANVLQMIGRAGRPGLDTHGIAVIMTQRKTSKLYESLAANTKEVESRLLEELLVVLNSEVAQGTISSIADAVEWMRSTFLFVRACKNPGYYNMPRNTNAKGVTDELQRRVLAGINGLAEYGMLKMAADGYCFNPMRAGQIMSRHYMQFDTMKALIGLNKSDDASEVSLEKLMLVVSSAPELLCGLRREEKKILNEVNKTSRFLQRNPKTKTKNNVVQTDQLKNFTLLQAAFTGAKLLSASGSTHYGLIQDQRKVCAEGARVCAAVTDLATREGKSDTGRSGGSNGSLALASYTFARSIQQHMWEVEDGQLLRQIDGVGPSSCQKLAEHGIHSFRDVLNTNAARINEILGRKLNGPGEEIVRRCRFIPQLRADVVQLSASPRAVKLQITISPVTAVTDNQMTHTLVALSSASGIDEGGGSVAKLLLYRKVPNLSRNDSFVSVFDVPAMEQKAGFCVVKFAILNDKYIGLDMEIQFFPKFVGGGSASIEGLQSTVGAQLPKHNDNRSKGGEIAASKKNNRNNVSTSNSVGKHPEKEKPMDSKAPLQTTLQSHFQAIGPKRVQAQVYAQAQAQTSTVKATHKNDQSEKLDLTQFEYNKRSRSTPDASTQRSRKQQRSSSKPRQNGSSSSSSSSGSSGSSGSAGSRGGSAHGSGGRSNSTTLAMAMAQNKALSFNAIPVQRLTTPMLSRVKQEILPKSSDQQPYHRASTPSEHLLEVDRGMGNSMNMGMGSSGPNTAAAPQQHLVYQTPRIPLQPHLQSHQQQPRQHARASPQAQGQSLGHSWSGGEPPAHTPFQQQHWQTPGSQGQQRQHDQQQQRAQKWQEQRWLPLEQQWRNNRETTKETAATKKHHQPLVLPTQSAGPANSQNWGPEQVQVPTRARAPHAGLRTANTTAALPAPASMEHRGSDDFDSIFFGF